jgi:hypothetical protein
MYSEAGNRKIQKKYMNKFRLPVQKEKKAYVLWYELRLYHICT